VCASFVATLLPAEYHLVSSRVSSHAHHTHRALLHFDTDFTGGAVKHFHCRVPPRLHHTQHAINMCHATELNALHALARTEYARTRLTQSHAALSYFHRMPLCCFTLFLPAMLDDDDQNEIAFREIPSHVLERACTYFYYKVCQPTQSLNGNALVQCYAARKRNLAHVSGISNTLKICSLTLSSRCACYSCAHSHCPFTCRFFQQADYPTPPMRSLFAHTCRFLT
jgi:hypothetical protein